MFAAWMTELLTDTRFTDLCINGTTQVFGDQGQGVAQIPILTPFSADEVLRWTIDQLSGAGKTWDAKHPFADFSLVTGHRVHAVFPPIAANGIHLSIRRVTPATLDQSRWTDTVNHGAFSLLKEAVRARESILVSGATGSGKTTLVMDLLSEVPKQERLLILEDVPELHPHHPHWVRLTSRAPNPDGQGEITLRQLLRQCLRMRPDRIILGECRGSEVLELLQALNTGHRGTLATLHANSPREALRRIELLAALSGITLPWTVTRDLIAGGIQWLVQVENRRIVEIARVEGREGEQILLRPVLQEQSRESRLGHNSCSFNGLNATPNRDWDLKRAGA